MLVKLGEIVHKIKRRENVADFFISLPVGIHYLYLSLNGIDYHMINLLMVVPSLHAPRVSSKTLNIHDAKSSLIVVHVKKLLMLTNSPCVHWWYEENTSISSHAIWHLAVTLGVALGMRQIYIHSQVAPNMSCEAWTSFRDLGHTAYVYGQATMKVAPEIAYKAAEQAAAAASCCIPVV